jgi:sarcosine oxidase
MMYDVIIAGLGGMGSATAWHLARRGIKVLGLEKFDIPHNNGSSHGINRIIRLAYFEHPDYVPILRRAYSLWRETEQLFGEQLLYVTGSIDSGTATSRIIEGARHACKIHHLDHEVMNGQELNARFKGYNIPHDHLAVLQPDGGFVASERAIVAHAQLALASGADLRAREALVSWEATDKGVRVTTTKGVYTAKKLILSTGEPEFFRLGAFPVSNTLFEEGHTYQFPEWGVPGFKIGIYHHLHEQGHADSLSSEPNAKDEEALRTLMNRYFPKAAGATMALRACKFTNTQDEHFIIDSLPQMPQIIVASPCSGHGFKFASAIGEILADLATQGESRFNLDLFKIGRF